MDKISAKITALMWDTVGEALGEDAKLDKRLIDERLPKMWFDPTQKKFIVSKDDLYQEVKPITGDRVKIVFKVRIKEAFRSSARVIFKKSVVDPLRIYTPSFLNELSPEIFADLPPINWPAPVLKSYQSLANELQNISKAIEGLPEDMKSEGSEIEGINEAIKDLHEDIISKKRPLNELNIEVHEISLKVWLYFIKLTKNTLTDGILKRYKSITADDLLKTALNIDDGTKINPATVVLKNLPEEKKRNIAKCLLILKMDNISYGGLGFDAPGMIEAFLDILTFLNILGSIDDYRRTIGNSIRVGDDSFKVVGKASSTKKNHLSRTFSQLINIADTAISGMSRLNFRTLIKGFEEQKANSVKELKIVEPFLLQMSQAKENGIDPQIVIRILEELKFLDLDKLSEWTKANGDRIETDALRNISGAELDRLAKITARQQSVLIENEIKILTAAVEWDMELNKRLDLFQKEYKKTHTEKKMICTGGGPFVHCRNEVLPAEKVPKNVSDEYIKNLNDNLEETAKAAVKEAEEYWSEKRPAELPSILELPGIFAKVKTLDDWAEAMTSLLMLRSDRYANFATIQNTITSRWLADPQNGVLNWIKDYVDAPLPTGLGKMTPMARQLAMVVFKDEDLKIPEEPEYLPEFNGRNLQNLRAVYSSLDYDNFSNGVLFFNLGVFSAMSGIYLSGIFRGAVMKAEISAGINASELSLLPRAGLWTAELAAEAAGFEAGSNIPMITITGIPSIGDLVKGTGEGMVIFGGMRFLEFLKAPFGFNAAKGEKLIEGAIDIPMAGKELRAVQETIGYHGSKFGLAYEGLHFALLPPYLQYAGVALNGGEACQPCGSSSWLSSAEHYFSLFFVILGARSMNFKTASIERTMLEKNLGTRAEALDEYYARSLTTIDQRLGYHSEVPERADTLAATHETFLKPQLKLLQDLKINYDVKRFSTKGEKRGNIADIRRYKRRKALRSVMVNGNTAERNEEFKPIITEQTASTQKLFTLTKFFHDLLTISRMGEAQVDGTIRFSTNGNRKAVEEAINKFNSDYESQVKLERIEGTVATPKTGAKPADDRRIAQPLESYRFVLKGNSSLISYLYRIVFPLAETTLIINVTLPEQPKKASSGGIN